MDFCKVALRRLPRAATVGRSALSVAPRGCQSPARARLRALPASTGRDQKLFPMVNSNTDESSSARGASGKPHSKRSGPTGEFQRKPKPRLVRRSKGSNVSSLPEVVGDAAMLVDPYSAESIADGILTVLRSTHLRDELSQRGLERVKAFSWARSVQRVREVYGEVLS